MPVEANILNVPTDWWMVAAAWVQAVGSIAAIVAAIVISRGSDRKAAAEKWQDRVDHISLVQGVANMAYRHIHHVARLIQSDDASLEFEQADEAMGETLSALLLRFDPQKLRSPPGAIGVITLANACASAAGYAETAGRLIHEQGCASVPMEQDIGRWVAEALDARNAVMEMTPEF